MEEQRDPWPQLHPNCALENAGALIANPDPIPHQTEDFPDNRKFCTRPLEGDAEMVEIYGNAQDSFNAQSAKVCLILTDLLVRCGYNADDIGPAFQTNRVAYAKKPQGLKHLDPDWTETRVLSTKLSKNTAELFFSYIGLYRHIMAAMSPKREDDWNHYGANRFLDPHNEHIKTPLAMPRYAPSVERYKQSALYKKVADDIPDGPDNTHIPVLKRSPGLPDICYFELSCGNGYWELWNLQILGWQYELTYREIDTLFRELLTEHLKAAKDFLTIVFKIQYWFIHIMPYHRGSAAGMNLIRYIFTAYYNYRVRGTDRPPLPVVPSKRGYFPDLEALLTCMTPEEFVEKSMTEIYCVDFSHC